MTVDTHCVVISIKKVILSHHEKHPTLHERSF